MYFADSIRFEALTVDAGRVKRVRVFHARLSVVARWLSAKRRNPALCGPFLSPRSDRSELCFTLLCARLVGKCGPFVTDPRVPILLPQHRRAIQSTPRVPSLWEHPKSPRHDTVPLRSMCRPSIISNIRSHGAHSNTSLSFRLVLWSSQRFKPGAFYVIVVLHHLSNALIPARRHRRPAGFAFVLLDRVPVAAVLGAASPRGPPDELFTLVARPGLFQGGTHGLQADPPRRGGPHNGTAGGSRPARSSRPCAKCL